jgi:hypothetical protein
MIDDMWPRKYLVQNADRPHPRHAAVGLHAGALTRYLDDQCWLRLRTPHQSPVCRFIQ